MLNQLNPEVEQLFDSSISSYYTATADRTNQLLPQERDLIINSVESRQQEFSSGRWCAHQAIRTLGLTDSAILMGPNREPIWPPGVVGSISHCPDWSIAVAASADKVSGLGVDVERLSSAENLPLTLLYTKSELKWLSSNPAEQQTTLKMLVFSAKESIYKAFFPHFGKYIDYLQVELRFNQEQHTFEFSFHLKALNQLLKKFDCVGRYRYFDNHVWTATTLLNR